MPVTLTNPYTRQAMDDAVRIYRNPRRFLTELLFGRLKVENAPSIQFDVVKGGESAGAYVGPNSKAIPLDRAAFTTKTLTPPLLSFSRSITGKDLEDRLPGRNPFEGGDGAAELQAQDYDDIFNVMDRAMELQASQALTSGQITLKDVNGNTLGSVVDFGATSGMRPSVLTGTDVWTNSASDPLGDIRRLAELVSTYGDVPPEVVLMRTGLFTTLAKNTEFKSQLDNRRGPAEDQLAIKAQGMNAMFRGRIENMDVYTYDGSYKLPGSDTRLYYLDPKKVIVASTKGEGTRYFSQIFSAQAGGMVTTDRYLDSDVTWNPDAITVRGQSRPLLVPRVIDSIACQQVVT